MKNWRIIILVFAEKFIEYMGELIMSRILNEKEKETFIENREVLHEHLSELQADLEDMPDEELIGCRGILLERVNWCLQAILEIDEDNI